MAWNPLVFGLTVTVLLVLEGFHSEVSACGSVNEDTRASGADADAPGNWPWLVSLSKGGNHVCSGSLITRGLILTSAYCINLNFGDGSTITANMGYNQAMPSPAQVSIQAFVTYRPFRYDANTGEDDLDLLVLRDVLTFTDTIQPICFAGEDSVFPTGQSSWGIRRKEGNVLQEVKLRVVGNEECRNIHGSKVTENTICAEPEAEDDEDEFQQGDLGSPLIVQQGTSWIQFGVMSFGSRWANATTPRSYTLISRLIEDMTTNSLIFRVFPPSFVSFIVGGVDSNLNFTSTTHEPTTLEPTTLEPTTLEPTTLEPTILEPTTLEPTILEPTTDDRSGDSIFDSGESAISFSHFTHLAAMCSLALCLWVFG